MIAYPKNVHINIDCPNEGSHEVHEVGDRHGVEGRHRHRGEGNGHRHPGVEGHGHQPLGGELKNQGGVRKNPTNTNIINNMMENMESS